MAEVVGVEPTLSESKSDMLPLHNTSMLHVILDNYVYKNCYAHYNES